MCRIAKCCVLNCSDRTSVRHRFPKNEKDVFEIWKLRAQHPRFTEISDEHIYKVYIMCGAHFKTEDQIPNSKKLKKRVLPTMNIPGLDEAVKMIQNVSSEDETVARHNHQRVLPKAVMNKNSVKRKSADSPELTAEGARKKPRIPSANTGCDQDIMINDILGIEKYIWQ